MTGFHKTILLPVCIILMSLSSVASAGQTVNILHFSDYHSNALATTTIDGGEQGGIARLMHLLKQQDKENSLIFSGGDMMNKGSPAWSDKYQCTEWPWFNGLIDAMALGNHETDYGAEAFAQCREEIDYPILSSNVLLPSGKPLLLNQGKSYMVYSIGEARIGVFALAGPDFINLLKPDTLPAENVIFADRVDTARQVVAKLRTQEQVSAIVLIGHAHFEDDISLAQQVEGIDLILGTHSHRKQELMQIAQTDTWYIAPFQYLSHVSKVSLHFSETELQSISGGLIELNEQQEEDSATANLVTRMQAELETDPVYAHKFKVLGNNPHALAAPVTFNSESVLGNFVTDLVREKTGADVALLTSSTFRKSIPAGTIKEYHLTDALPYENKILLHNVSGEKLKEIIDYSVSRAGSDFFSQVSGMRFSIAGGVVKDLQIATQAGDYQSVKPRARYRLATSDFQSLFADGYKQFFTGSEYETLPETLWELVRETLASEVAMAATNIALDGRIRTEDIQ